MTVLLQLGSLALEGFEVPGRIVFGGAQSLAVHKLPGGVRIVDTMGPDDIDLAWSGVISGGNASERARLLDVMRVAGEVQSLSWDQFTYSVLIGRLTLQYRNPWWIDYRIACKVVRDEAQAILPAVLSSADAIAVDLASAGAYVDVGDVSAATGAARGLGPGTPAVAAAESSLITMQTFIRQGIGMAEADLDSSELPAAVSACGLLASLTYAQGFVNRAARNFSDVDG